MIKRLLKTLLFSVMIIWLLLPHNVYAAVDNYVGNYSNSGVGAFNPNYVVVYDPESGSNKGYVAYAYQSATNVITLKVWDVISGSEALTTTLTMSGSYVGGIAIFYTMRLGDPYDGFYVIVFSSNLFNNNPSTQYAYGNVYFVNMTTKAVTTITTANIFGGTYYTIYDTCVFSNVVYTTGKDVILLISASAYQADYWIRVVMFELTPTTANVYVGNKYISGSLRYYGLSALWVSPHFSNVLIFNSILWQVFDNNGLYLYGRYYLGSGFDLVYTQTQTTFVRNRVLSRASNFQLQGFYKFKGLQRQGSTWPERFYAYWAWYDQSSGNTYMELFQTDHTRSGGGGGAYTYSVSAPVVSHVFIITGTEYNIDLQNPYMSTSDNYFYDPDGFFFNAAYNPDSGVKTTTITLQTTPNPDTYIFSGYGYFRLDKSNNKVHIWVRASQLPTVYTIPSPEGRGVPPTNPEEPDYTTTAVYTAIGFALPALFLFVPALLLGEKAGMIGLVVGLALSATLLTLTGLIPLWATVLIGVGIMALIFLGRRGEA